MALSLFGDGGDLSSLFQQASAAPKQAYAQPQSPPPAVAAAPSPQPDATSFFNQWLGNSTYQTPQSKWDWGNGNLQSLFPTLDINQMGNTGYMQQFSNPDQGSGDRYLVKGADGNTYGVNNQNGTIDVTGHYGTGDSGGGVYKNYGMDGSLLGTRDYQNYTHNVRDAVGMSAMVLGGVAGVMGAGGAMAGEGMSGMDMAADGAAGFAPSGYGAGAMSAGPGSAGWGMDLGGAGLPDGAAQGYAGGSGIGSAAGGGGAATSGLTGNPIIDKALTAAGTSALGQGVSSALSGGSGSTASGVGGILSGAYDAYAKTNAANNMLDYMKTQQGKIDSIYTDPNSPVAKYMWNQMSAADAAAGRNSQYGTRTTDFLGKFGGDYAKYTAALTQGLAGNYANAYNQQAAAGTGLAAGINNAISSGTTSGLNSLIQNGSSYINNAPNGGGYNQWASTGLGTGSVNGDQIYG